MGFEIDRGMAIPPQYEWKKYPLLDLEVGDSFFVSASDVKDIGPIRNRLTTRAIAVGQRHGRKFTVRKSDEPLGIRVWRTK